jgi:hypothetical protein
VGLIVGGVVGCAVRPMVGHAVGLFVGNAVGGQPGLETDGLVSTVLGADGDSPEGDGTEDDPGALRALGGECGTAFGVEGAGSTGLEPDGGVSTGI